MADQSSLASRLREAVDKAGGVRTVAVRASLAPGTVYGYLRGDEPGLSRVLALARAADVNLLWLVTGRGTPVAPILDEPSSLDCGLISRVRDLVAETVKAFGWTTSPAEAIDMLVAVYELVERSPAGDPWPMAEIMSALRQVDARYARRGLEEAATRYEPTERDHDPS
jgi:hypothetical protein